MGKSREITRKDSAPRRRTLRQLVRSRDGAAAIEFALLAIPYFLIVFAIIETFIAFMAEQLVSTAVDNMARQIRMGQITYGLNLSSNKDRDKFREAFCDEISILIRCSEEEIKTPQKLYLDVRSFPTFADIPKEIPRVSDKPFADLDALNANHYSPGGPKSINMVRAYYRWQIITDLVRPYITTIRPEGQSMPTDFLIVGTAAFQNEDYPL
ncbi:TadE/TadG family type IV pilus assembly protein [Rhizobium sp. LC145]|jgi:Flp pilus assembly protein TadG|uniref:TadE/TadG family type IV pilus assembly protein n=1 Tax=Rhizobium sp. LC145 TaxID=1120688 RepID=UPI000629FF8F|nr:TadE/TadG family type IV pilus assembly protein [Rhizobium sp. LC145]KKX31676.1 pilus assembly protein TadG [Rhizobium sp. LC145]TKT59868.1 pilus assembly protein [Rhizobiaceae bacterium LC148]